MSIGPIANPSEKTTIPATQAPQYGFGLLEPQREPEYEGFHSGKDALYFYEKQNGKSPKRIPVSAPIQVTARTRNKEGQWGKLVEFSNPDNVPVKQIILEREFERPADLRGKLRDLGLRIFDKNLLIEYLHRQNPSARALLVDKVGWHGDIFVLPGGDCSFNGEIILCDIESHDYRVSGITDEWKREIGAHENPFFI